MILLIDDEVIVREVGSELLSILGYKVTCASDGPTGLDILAAHPGEFKLVIMDMIMPRMSGSEVFHQIRAREPDLRILISSGYSLDDTALDLIRQGNADFIQKPFDIKELSRRVQQLMT